MKKNNIIAIAILMVVASIFCVGCNKDKSKQSALDFKEEYEKVNEKVMIKDIKYRSLNIDEDNPYVKVSIDEIAKKIENEEEQLKMIEESKKHVLEELKRSKEMLLRLSESMC